MGSAVTTVGDRQLAAPVELVDRVGDTGHDQLLEERLLQVPERPLDLALAFGVTGLTGATRSGFDRISLGMGVLGLIGTALFVSDYYRSIGQGGMERVAAYPLTVWLILAG